MRQPTIPALLRQPGTTTPQAATPVNPDIPQALQRATDTPEAPRLYPAVQTLAILPRLRLVVDSHFHDADISGQIDS